MRMLTKPEVRERWAWIRAGLLEVAERAGSDFLPEDVFVEVMAERSSVFIQTDGNGDEIAFAVLNRVQYPQKNVLFVWATWSAINGLVDDAMLAELDALAASGGCQEIECRSRRKGWARRGFEVAEYIYRRKV